jgi:hypothetical protein
MREIPLGISLFLLGQGPVYEDEFFLLEERNFNFCGTFWNNAMK